MSLPALVLLLFVALTSLAAVRVQIQCVDAARETARAAARGENAEAAGRRVAPPGATISVGVDNDTVSATVRVWITPLGAGPSFTVEATAVASIEPGVNAGPDVGVDSRTRRGISAGPGVRPRRGVGPGLAAGHASTRYPSELAESPVDGRAG